ncbi:MAG TPA: flippase [Chitinophagaceae bacterium]
MFREVSGDTGDFVIRNSSTLFIVNCCALLAGFVANFVLIRCAGLTNYGAYVYLFNFFTLAVNFSLLGTDTLVLRRISRFEQEGSFNLSRGVFRFATMVALFGSVAIGVLSPLLLDDAHLPFIGPLLLTAFSAACITFLSLTAVNQSALQAFRRMITGQVVEKLARPLFMIVAALIIFFVLGDLRFEHLIGIGGASVAIVFVVTTFIAWRLVRRQNRGATPQFETNDWLRESTGFWLLGILYVLNSRVDIFLLGLLRNADDVGRYNIAARVSEVIGFVLVAVNFVLSPLIARLYESAPHEMLQKLITMSAKAVLFFTLPIGAAVILFASPIMHLFRIYDGDAVVALLILAGAQLINVICGSVGTILMMTGKQKYSVYSLLAGTIVSIGLNLALVPQFGVRGAAIATASGMITWNVMMYFFVRRKLNINPTAF